MVRSIKDYSFLQPIKVEFYFGGVCPENIIGYALVAAKNEDQLVVIYKDFFAEQFFVIIKNL